LIALCVAGCSSTQSAPPVDGAVDDLLALDEAIPVYDFSPIVMSDCDPDDCATNGCGQGRVCFPNPSIDGGICLAQCDLFDQSLCGPGFACYPSGSCGRGDCFQIIGNGKDGNPCSKNGQCSPGLACAKDGSCRPMCGGAGQVACSNGKACADFSATVTQAILGLCNG
jgi:hypothetical protein